MVFSKSVNGFRICLTETVYGGDTMNELLYTLSPEKQQAIINAGYRVFSQNSYKNSPMSEIAAEAGISKSLLFHYFHNKMIIPGLFEPPVRTLRATIPENERHIFR